MKIGTENLLNTYSARSAKEASAAITAAAADSWGKNYDEVVFTPTSRQKEEKLFIGKITETLKAEIRSLGGQEEKIESLREAVRNGQYIPDSRETAARILLLGGSV